MRILNILKYKKTKATLMRAKYDGQADYIKIILPDGAERHLFYNIVAHSAKALSPNERKKAIADCEEQIDNLKDGNCPTIFREMLNKLKYGEFKETEEIQKAIRKEIEGREKEGNE